MSLSRGGRGGLTNFLEKGTLSLSTEFFYFDGFPNGIREFLKILTLTELVWSESGPGMGSDLDNE